MTATGSPLQAKETRKERSFEITSDAYKIYQAPQASDAQSLLKAFEEKWQPLEPDDVRTFLKDIELTFTFYQFDDSLHHHLRTTNHLERLFREFRTNSDKIAAFPNETSCFTFGLLSNATMLNMTVEITRINKDTNMRWIITALAIYMGAPFWFDILGKLVNVRSTGKKS